MPHVARTMLVLLGLLMHGLISGVSSVFIGPLEFVPHDTFITSSELTISQAWTGLGPFRIGTREQVWGADPLERYGGFMKQQYSEIATYPSPLLTNASVKWSQHEFKIEQQHARATKALISLNYTNVDWDFMQHVYGWSALQFQGWVRGTIENGFAGTQQALIYPIGIFEFYLNGEHFFGADFYGFNRTPIAVDLHPGSNQLDIRLIRDVRSMGGILPASIDASLQVQLATRGVQIDIDHVVAPDLVNGSLPSLYMSIPVTNLHHGTIFFCECNIGVHENDVQNLVLNQVDIAPGQTRPIGVVLSADIQRPNLNGVLCYRWADNPKGDAVQLDFSYKLQTRGLYEAQKFTFLHPSKAVSYAVTKPPSTALDANVTRPLLVYLHGAGVDADSEAVRQTFDEIPDLEAFTLFPTGMSPWSGDDWHVWGFADVIAAIDAMHDWTETMAWNGPTIQKDKIFISGHSNGGQGTWYFATHMPDLTVAAAPVSGYTSIDNYVPYNFWNEADPLQMSILKMARASYKHELLIDNIFNLPIRQEHGSADDNVPPYHSRLMKSLLAQSKVDSTYIELPGAGHYFGTVMTTTPLREFYHQHLSGIASTNVVPSHFSFVSPGTSEFGSKFGWSIDQLISPDRLGRIDVDITYDDPIVWHIKSSNVRRLRFDPSSTWTNLPLLLRFDHQEQLFTVHPANGVIGFVRLRNGQWVQADFVATLTDRFGTQRGSLDAILRSKAAFRITTPKNASKLAVQISRNMLQYFGADSEIVANDAHSETPHLHGNLITLSVGKHVPPSVLESFPISFAEAGITLRASTGSTQVVRYESGMGAAILRPLPNERLQLLVWGIDSAGLQQAARLIPTLVGGGQPDFTILGEGARWQGTKGALALGFFDSTWNISSGSYLP